jgi:hypothetical protein
VKRLQKLFAPAKLPIHLFDLNLHRRLNHHYRRRQPIQGLPQLQSVLMTMLLWV